MPLPERGSTLRENILIGTIIYFLHHYGDTTIDITEAEELGKQFVLGVEPGVNSFTFTLMDHPDRR